MGKVFEIGTKVIVRPDVLERMGGDAYYNNCWEVIDTSRDREDNDMYWLKNTETDMEPEESFYFEALHEYHDRIECTFAEQDDEHAQEDLMLVCSGRGTLDQDMNIETINGVDYLKMNGKYYKLTICDTREVLKKKAYEDRFN